MSSHPIEPVSTPSPAVPSTRRWSRCADAPTAAQRLNRGQPACVPPVVGPQPAPADIPSLASIDAGLSRAVPDEAELISGLFVEAYGMSSHPGREPAFLRASMAAGDVWLVQRVDGVPVGCVCTARLPWRGVYEIASIVVTATEQGRAVGAALSAGARQVAASNPDCRVLCARLRSPVATFLAWRDPLIPLPPLGHDGGLEMARQRHEVHVMSVNINRFSPPRRGAAPLGSPVEELYDLLPWPAHPVTELAAWPTQLVVTPHSANWWSTGFTGLLDPRSATLPELSATRAAEAVAEVEAWLADRPEVRHVSAIVPADKVDFVVGLQRLGFSATAYLPTWYEHEGVFFDCLLVTRVVGDPADPMGQQDLIDEWDATFERLGLASSYSVV